LKFTGLNRVGLERRGFSGERRRLIKDCYRKIYNSDFNVSQAIEVLQEQYGSEEDAQTIITFVRQAERGLIP